MKPAQVTFQENVSFTGWGSGGAYYASTRNHHYKLTLDESNPEVVIQLASSTLALTYFVYSDAQYHSGNALPDLTHTVEGQKQQQITLKNYPAGNYYLVVGTSQEGDIGEYSMTTQGITTKPAKVSFELLESSNQQRSEEGSRGIPFGFMLSVELLSERNPRYTFTVDQAASWVDIEMLATQGDINGVLYDPQGNQLHIYGEPYAVSAIHKVHYLKAGIYTLLIGSFDDNNKGTFTLRLSGHVSQLKRKQTHLTLLTDDWTPEGGLLNYYQTRSTGKSHLYEVRIDSASTVLDLVLTTRDDISVGLFLVDENRRYVGSSQASARASILTRLAKGRYYILVATNGWIGGLQKIPYKLSIYGQVEDVKKL